MGSYKNIVDEDGKLLSRDDLAIMLAKSDDINEDVYQIIEEMYGMVWALADRAAEAELKIEGTVHRNLKWYVAQAREGYHIGIVASPGKN